jgi:hypothetical protein
MSDVIATVETVLGVRVDQKNDLADAHGSAIGSHGVERPPDLEDISSTARARVRSSRSESGSTVSTGLAAIAIVCHYCFRFHSSIRGRGTTETSAGCIVAFVAID